jgi:hypothetical protein
VWLEFDRVRRRENRRVDGGDLRAVILAFALVPEFRDA